MKSQSTPTALANGIADRILLVRGRKVLLDEDLALMYGVLTRQFNQAVRRNLGRFPADFCFRLTNQEYANLKSQFGDGLRISVEVMAVADHLGAKADEGRSPKEHGGRI